MGAHSRSGTHYLAHDGLVAIARTAPAMPAKPQDPGLSYSPRLAPRRRRASHPEPAIGMTAVLIVILFLLSGFLGLVYEVVWIRKLGLVFGSTSIALSTVLGIFFGGLALGSFLFGRLAGTSRHLIRTYAVLEIGIGLLAFLFPTLLGWVDRFYGALYPGPETHFLVLTLVRVLLVMPLIAIPTTLMGGTLPILSRHFVRSHRHLSTRVGGLYAINTLGGALGAYLCGFYFIHRLGVNATNYWAAAVNVAVGLIALAISRTADEGTSRPEEPAAGSPAPASRRSPADRRLVALAFAGFALSGLTGLAYEVVWARYLSLFLVHSIYAYTTILTVFLVGIVLGAVSLSSWIEGRKNLFEIFGYVQIAIALSALTLLPALVAAQELVSRRAGNLFVREFVLCALLMIVPTTLMGATLPLVTKIATREIRRVGRTVGSLYAVNTLGAIAGSALAGFVLLPWLGIGGSNRLLVALNLGLGLSVLVLAPGVRRGRALALSAGAVLLAAAAHAAVGSRVPESRLAQIAGGAQRIVAVEEGLVNTVWISEDSIGRRSLWTDSSIMGRTGPPFRRELSPQRVQGHIPMLLHPGKTERVLGIAFGTGQTFGAQILYPIERLDVVDISRVLVDVSLAHFSDVQSGLGDDPRLHVVIDDGRSFVDRTSSTYDVISLEMPPHEEAGIVHFYTLDFYRTLRSRLRPDGIVAQWVPIYNVTPEETIGVTRTFIEVFPQSALWYNASNLLLLGFESEFRIDVDRIRERLALAPVFEDLDVSYLDDGSSKLNRSEGFVSSFLIGPEGLARFARDGRIYTDDRPDLEFTWTEFEVWGPERRDLLVLGNTDAIAAHLSEWDDDLAGAGGSHEGSDLAVVRNAYLDKMRAQAFDNLGTHLAARDPGRSLGYYQAALRLRPDFAQAHNNLGTLYLEQGRAAQAIQSYREAVRLDPRNAQAFYNLGTAYGRQGMAREALAAYDDALRIRPDYPRVHVARGNLLAESGSTVEAENAYRAAIEADPTSGDAFLALASLLAETGDREAAMAALDAMRERLPDDRRARALRRRLTAD